MSYPSLAANTQLLTKRRAAHLLRRTTYNFDIARIIAFTELTPDQAVDHLFEFDLFPLKYSTGPLNWSSNSTPAIFNLGDTSDIGVTSSNDIGRSAIMWATFEALQDKSIRWKIMHWLHSIFPVRVNAYLYHYWRLLEACFECDLKTIVMKITTDSCMMKYLDNVSNTKNGPNENFAREVLELMTIRKGPSVELGNYTHYTEEDIENAAKVLTGFTFEDPTWTADHMTPPQSSVFNEVLDTGIASATPTPTLHDFSEKVFSTQLAGLAEGDEKPTIADLGVQTEERMYEELKEFYSIVYGNEETSRSFVRRMYQFFVQDEIDQQTEDNIIIPLASDLKNYTVNFAEGYDYIYVLKKLLKSNHFYDLDDEENYNENIGGKIKSPWELLFQSINVFNAQIVNENGEPVQPVGDKNDAELLFRNSFKVVGEQHLQDLGLNPRGPDTVEGYSGFYEEPKFSKNWFSSSNLYRRYTIGESLKGNYVNPIGSGMFSIPFPIKFCLFDFVRQFETFDDNQNVIIPPDDTYVPFGVAKASHLVTELISALLPELDGYDDEQDSNSYNNKRYTYFEDALLGGLSRVNWYFSWVAYLGASENDENFNELKNNVQVGLERLFDSIISSPEFQTF